MRRAVALVTLAVAVGACGGDDTANLLNVTGTVHMTIHHSRFAPDHLQVRAGTTLRLVVHNEDPIDHELIVGDAEVHRRHATGTEPHHGEKPGEVSVPARSSAATTYSFEEPGTIAFACHLPGHREYGMHGVVRVVGSFRTRR